MGIEQIIREKGLEGLGRYYSIYRGTVVSNQDPKFLCRLQLKVPDVYGNNVLEEWALPRGMPAGKDIGLIAIPQAGDTVWVTFENGSPVHPIWEAGYFAENQVLDVAKEGGAQRTKMVWQGYGKERIVLDKAAGIVRIENSTGQTEFALMGETWVGLMEEFMDDLGNLAGIPVVTSTPPVAGPLNNSPLWAPFVATWKAKFKTGLSKFLKHS